MEKLIPLIYILGILALVLPSFAIKFKIKRFYKKFISMDYHNHDHYDDSIFF